MRLGTLLLLSLLLGFGCSSDNPSTSTTIRWPVMPVTLYASSSFLTDSASTNDLHQAMTFWEQKAGKTLFNFQGAWSGDPTQTNTIVSGDLTNPTSIYVNLLFIPDTWPFDETFAGKTAVNYENNVIQHSIVMLNKNITYCHADCNDIGDIGLVSEQRAIAHELGHFLGFPHTTDISNIMYPTIQPGGSLTNESVDMGLLQALTN